MTRKTGTRKENKSKSDRVAREPRSSYATNAIALAADLVLRIDEACRDLAITREEFVREAVAAKLRRASAYRPRIANARTRTEIQVEWERKRNSIRAALRESSGAWANRSDLGETTRWVRQLRRSSSRRLKRLRLE